MLPPLCNWSFAICWAFFPTNCTPRLDDIQDGSALRRGRPAAHKVFGQGQTMNSAFFFILRAVEEAAVLNGAEATGIVIGMVF
jgi:geranylgeranyl pyrophosphate synthase